MLKIDRFPKSYRMVALIIAHSVLFYAAYLGAFLIRFDFQIPADHLGVLQQTIWFVVGIKLVIFYIFRMFQGWWKYISLYDVLALVKALAIASAVVLCVNVFVLTPSVFARSIYFLDFVFSLMFIGGARGGLRLLRESIANRSTPAAKTTKLLIIGAGDTGETLLREITKNKNLHYKPVALLDDASFKHGLRIHGVPVLGSIDKVDEVVEKHNVEHIIIAIPSATREEMRRIVSLTSKTRVETKMLPGVASILEGRVAINQLREVSINDLLGRDPVQLDTRAIARFIEARTVMITGAGGSIGSELCRQVLRFNPHCVLMVDSAETPLFFIHREVAREHEGRVTPYVANVCDRDRMAMIFKQHRPDVVIHAAAYKHVPMMEKNPCEAVKNNVIGTQTVANLAAEYQTSTFVLISTDKAVNPTSIMGATKRVTELYIHGLNKTYPQTRFCAVRFGNVLGSNGSVVPIFREQIKNGGPVTVTHPEMTRYFMTIPEAVQLVLQAAAFKSDSELFILDMGEPVKIADLARDMIRLSGASEEQVSIVFSGVRPGEKLYEELALDEENVDTTSHSKIFVGKSVSQEFDNIREHYAALILAANSGRSGEVRRQIKNIIPTYRHPESQENVVYIEEAKSQTVINS